MKINYTKHGRAFSDFEVEEFLFRNFANDEMINSSTENIFVIARLWKIIGLLNNVEFYFEGSSLGKVDENGITKKYPHGFCDFSEKNHRKIIDARFSK